MTFQHCHIMREPFLSLSLFKRHPDSRPNKCITLYICFIYWVYIASWPFPASSHAKPFLHARRRTRALRRDGEKMRKSNSTTHGARMSEPFFRQLALWRGKKTRFFSMMWERVGRRWRLCANPQLSSSPSSSWKICFVPTAKICFVVTDIVIDIHELRAG